MKAALIKARRLYERNRYQAAMIAAKQVLDSDKGNEEALFYVAHGLYYAKQYRRSLLYWKRLEKLNSAEPNLHLNIGACYEDLGENRAAIRNYKTELELNPVCGHALYNLGAFYFRSRRYQLALEYLERCYSQKHCVDACVSKLAYCYFKTGQLEKEQMLYEDFLETHPDDKWALNNLGSHLMKQGEYTRALIRLKKAARLDPNDRLVAKNIRKAERSRKKLYQRNHETI